MRWPRWLPLLAACATAACGGTEPRPEVPVTETPLSEAPSPRLEPTAPAPAPVATEAAPSPSVERPPATLRLKVAGFEDAIVSFPEKAPLPAPVMIVTHGAGNTPESMCEVLRLVVGDGPVLLCPAGPRMSAGWEGRYYPDHFALEKIVFAALAALVEAHPRQVDPANAVYSGYSQGATMGALMIPEHGKQCPLLALIEGGVEGWTAARARKFKAEGGQRVLFACGTPHCRKHAEKVSDTFRGVGLEANVVYGAGAGHTYGGAVAEALAASFDWLVKDDARFVPRSR